MVDPSGFQQSRSSDQWNALVSLWKQDFMFDPAKDSELTAAEWLATGKSEWEIVWRLFDEQPAAYHPKDSSKPAPSYSIPQALTGSELLAKVKELGEISKSDLVRSASYVSTKKDGTERLNFTAFYEALLEAKGVSLGDGGGSGGKGRPGRSLSFNTNIQFNGNLRAAWSPSVASGSLKADHRSACPGRVIGRMSGLSNLMHPRWSCLGRSSPSRLAWS